MCGQTSQAHTQKSARTWGFFFFLPGPNRLQMSDKLTHKHNAGLFISTSGCVDRMIAATPAGEEEVMTVSNAWGSLHSSDISCSCRPWTGVRDPQYQLTKLAHTDSSMEILKHKDPLIIPAAASPVTIWCAVCQTDLCLVGRMPASSENVKIQVTDKSPGSDHFNYRWAWETTGAFSLHSDPLHGRARQGEGPPYHHASKKHNDWVQMACLRCSGRSVVKPAARLMKRQTLTYRTSNRRCTKVCRLLSPWSIKEDIIEITKAQKLGQPVCAALPPLPWLVSLYTDDFSDIMSVFKTPTEGSLTGFCRTSFGEI